MYSEADDQLFPCSSCYGAFYEWELNRDDMCEECELQQEELKNDDY